MKKQLKIPFDYKTDQMLDYVDYEREVWFDIVDREYIWYEPQKPPDTVYDHSYNYAWPKTVPNPKYNEELKEYEIKLEEFNNNILSGRYIKVNQVVWKDNYEFEEEMLIEGYSRGRSAANFNLQSTVDKRNYNVFMKDILEIMQNCTISESKVKAKWTFTKRGANYGIKLVK